MLSDELTTAGIFWKDLKHQAMANDYKKKKWFKKLMLDERRIFMALREAQQSQGNMDPLEP